MQTVSSSSGCNGSGVCDIEAGYCGGASLLEEEETNDDCLDICLASSVDGVRYANWGGLNDGVGRPQCVSEYPYSLHTDIAFFDISMLYNTSDAWSVDTKSCWSSTRKELQLTSEQCLLLLDSIEEWVVVGEGIEKLACLDGFTTQPSDVMVPMDSSRGRLRRRPTTFPTLDSLYMQVSCFSTHR